MRSAMARVLTVNDFSGSPPVPRGNQDFNLDPEQAATDSEFGVEPDSYGVETTSYGVLTTRGDGALTSGKNRNDQGPCLYFGPQGQRCSRPALGSRPLARIVAIGVAIFAALWPIVADLLREIIRWIHAH